MVVQKQLHSFWNSTLDWVSRDRSVSTTVGLEDCHNTHTFHTRARKPTTIPWEKQAVAQLIHLLCYSQSRPNSNEKEFGNRLIFIYEQDPINKNLTGLSLEILVAS